MPPLEMPVRPMRAASTSLRVRQIVDEPHDVPGRVVEERMTLARLERARDRLVVFRGARARLRSLAVKAAVDGDADEAGLRGLERDARDLAAVFRAAGAVQHDDHRAGGP